MIVLKNALKNWIQFWVLAGVFLPATCLVQAQSLERQAPRMDVLTEEQWKRVDDGVDRGLAWLAAQQQADGAFPSLETGQPAVTSLGVMAFISRGHVPGVGPYGDTLNKAIDFVLRQQRDDGLLYGAPTDMPYEYLEGSHTGTYNHAIAGLMLGEVYGMSDEKLAKKLRPAIEKALDFARRMQRRRSPFPCDQFGWRYLKQMQRSNQSEADLSVTGWFVMFYRSAKNAEFDVPKEYVDEAIQFVRGCYVESEGAFYYGPFQGDHRFSRAMTGAGLLCLAITNNHGQIADATGRWVLQYPFADYNTGGRGRHDRYHYGAYYCSQAMFVLGGDYWRQFYPQLVESMLSGQAADGSWQPESAASDRVFGNCYTSALAILAMTPPYQLLPIYQR
jgi:hypothetical protein